MGTLWSHSCHWHLLVKPIPIPILTHLWADPHLAYQWLPALLKSNSGLLSFPPRMGKKKNLPPSLNPPLFMQHSCTLGLKLGWVHWSWCLLAATAWLKERDHMITLLLSVYICAFAGHHLCVHDFTNVVIATYDIFSLCVCVCARECACVHATYESMYKYLCITERVVENGRE